MVPAARPSRFPYAFLIVAFSLLAIAAAAPAAAQILYGSVVGIVKDSTGGRLPGATVTMRESELMVGGGERMIEMPVDSDLEEQRTGIHEEVGERHANSVFELITRSI